MMVFSYQVGNPQVRYLVFGGNMVVAAASIPGLAFLYWAKMDLHHNFHPLVASSGILGIKAAAMAAASILSMGISLYNLPSFRIFETFPPFFVVVTIHMAFIIIGHKDLLVDQVLQCIVLLHLSCLVVDLALQDIFLSHLSCLVVDYSGIFTSFLKLEIFLLHFLSSYPWFLDRFFEIEVYKGHLCHLVLLNLILNSLD